MKQEYVGNLKVYTRDYRIIVKEAIAELIKKIIE